MCGQWYIARLSLSAAIFGTGAWLEVGAGTEVGLLLVPETCLDVRHSPASCWSILMSDVRDAPNDGRL